MDRKTYKAVREYMKKAEDIGVEYRIVNRSQLQKFTKIYDFFTALEDRGECRIENISRLKMNKGVSISVVCWVFDLYADRVGLFCDLLKQADYFDVSSLESGELRLVVAICDVA